MLKRKKSSPRRAPQFRTESLGTTMLRLRLPAAMTLIIAIAAFIAYFPSLSGGFIWDDELLISLNRFTKAPDGLYGIWCTNKTADYWPVTNTSFWIEWRLWGTQTTGYHVTNLFLHIANTLLIWIILRKLSIPGAFLAALIFAIHPVNVESVAWIAQRKNTLSMFFFLLSILCYLKLEIPLPSSQNGIYRISSPLTSGHHVSGRSPLAPRPSPLAPRLSPLWYWLSLMGFVLAMLSKGSAAVLPVLLLEIIWWRRTGTVPNPAGTVPIRHWRMGLSPSVWRWDLLRLAPFFALAAVLAGVDI